MVTTYCQIDGEDFLSIFVAFSENVDFNVTKGPFLSKSLGVDGCQNLIKFGPLDKHEK